MITKNHPSRYTDLFAKANAALRANNSRFETDYSEIEITNIDEYFACLRDLAYLEELSAKNEIAYIDPVFTILPATEDTFNIDANKRSISIPDNFVKHGVGVQGDEVAEVLYFSIDRYFDAMDLADMDIIVQWKHEKDEEHVSFLSATYKKSLTLQPGKIVFGWPITSEVTGRSGNVKFSIRFYRRDEEDPNKLIYSFSTLTTNIKIQTGLNFNLDKDVAVFNKNDLIYKNLRNSKNASIDYIIASPLFTGCYTLLDPTTLELENANATQTYDLPQTFVVKAEIPATTPNDQQVSGSGLSYSWLKKDSNNEVQNSRHIYKETSGPYNPYEIYYIKNENDVYEPYGTFGDSNPFDDAEPLTVYVRYSAFEPLTAGVYVAQVSNIYAPGASASALTGTWTVPYAAMPEFTYANDKVVLNRDTGKAIVEINYSVSDNGELAAEWLKGQNATIDGAVKIEGVSGNTYEATEEGYYFVKVNNTKNNSTTEAISRGVWVRHQASIPQIVSHKVNNTVKTEAPYGAYVGDTLSVVVNNPTYGVLSYQWRKGAEILSGATSNSLVVESAGTYDCVITNTYKETVESINSGTFNVSANIS